MWRRMRGRNRERRQSGRLTRRELNKSLSRRARKWVKEVWQAASLASARFDGLSPVTTPLANTLVENYGARQGATAEDIQRALLVALTAGYASRMVLVEPTEQPSLKPASLHLRGRPDVDRISGDPAAINNLLGPVRTIASEQFESVMTLPHPVWNGYVAMATNQLQGQLASDTLSWRDLGRDRIERMLRYGYVLRCLDETLRLLPAVREASSARVVKA